MRRTFFRFSLLISFIGVLAFGSAVFAGPFRVAGIQTTAGRIGCTQNKTGYQLRLSVAPLKCGSAQLASKKYILHIGPFDEAQAARNAARLWALYE